MKTLGVIANCEKKHAPVVLKELSEIATELGLELIAAGETADLLPTGRCLDVNDMFDEAEAVIVLGGDGSMLRAVREMRGIDKPLMGVNIGSLGFMTSVAEKDLARALTCLKEDHVIVSHRSVMECRVERKGRTVSSYRALNDVVLASDGTSRIVTLGLSIDGVPVTSYSCDGIVVSTPTGSTGHSLSAGGPIIAPDARAFVVSLICPHTLSSRPLVLRDESEIAVCVEDDERDILLSVDGQLDEYLSHEDRVVIKRSGRGVSFLHLPGYDYFSVLRQKLKWSGSSV